MGVLRLECGSSCRAGLRAVIWGLVVSSVMGVATGAKFSSCSSCVADDAVTNMLRSLDSRVIPENLREAVEGQVAADQQRRLRQANDESSAEWRAVKSLDDWSRLRKLKLAALRKSLSLHPAMAASAAVNKVRIEASGQVAGAGFVVENILYESHPGVWVSANLYRPEPPLDSMPGLIISHAHHTSKEHGELQDMGMTWARAGCLVLIPDHPGHGERRQHPFASAADFDKKFRVGPADYYFRYDNAIQLDLIGESLMGWMVRDLSRGADVLLAQKGIDPQRMILLGAVAGGGDPAAVAGALDERFAAVVPFNFGGPQPETRFPLPADAETSFHYAGGGSWESTRNLRRSAGDGFLPWLIVGSVAPRRLVYGHEFRWDRDRDPVWKRLQSIYAFYGTADSLAFTHGHGELKGQPPEASHCTHIGKPHRVRIHQAFEHWFGIKVAPDSEFSQRIPPHQLRCWTPELRRKLQPQGLANVALQVADDLVIKFRENQERLRPDCRRLSLRSQWDGLLGETLPEKVASVEVGRTQSLEKISVTSVMLTTATGFRIPCVLLVPNQKTDQQPVVLGICSQGKSRLLTEKGAEVSEFLGRGAAVCLCDPRGLGESGFGKSHGRRSEATGIASTELMLGDTLLGRQLMDVRTTMAWLRTRPELKGRRFHVWGESLAPAHSDSARFRQPRDDDAALPAPSEPQAALVALLTGLFEEDVQAIDAAGGIASWRLLLDGYLVLMAYDALVPGVLTAGDIADLVNGQRADTRIRLSRSVDGLNRLVSQERMRKLFEARLKAGGLSLE